VNVELSLPDEVLVELAERVAGRVLAELGTRSEPTGEPWHLLDVEAVAARLGRSGRWVRERAKRGDLPFVKLDGGALAFDLEDVRSFARERRIACSPLAGTPEAVYSGGLSGAHLRTIQKVRPR
jgi:hypothetical protein